jgi:hypothetical protein
MYRVTSYSHDVRKPFRCVPQIINITKDRSLSQLTIVCCLLYPSGRRWSTAQVVCISSRAPAWSYSSTARSMRLSFSYVAMSSSTRCHAVAFCIVLGVCTVCYCHVDTRTRALPCSSVLWGCVATVFNYAVMQRGRGMTNMQGVI